MNLRQLEYLVAIADHGSFRAAATSLGVAQPSLSAQIKRLETEVGRELVVRGQSGAVLNAEGLAVAALARTALEAVEQIRQVGAGPTRRLRLGIIPTLANCLLEPVIEVINRAQPNMLVLASDQQTATLVTGLLEGEFDAAIMAEVRPEPALFSQVIAREEFLLALPSASPLARGRGSVPLQTLEGMELIMLSEGHCLRDQSLRFARRFGARGCADFTVGSVSTLLQMVSQGAGAALVPALAANSTEGISFKRFSDYDPHRIITLVTHRQADDKLPGQLWAALQMLGGTVKHGGFKVVNPIKTA